MRKNPSKLRTLVFLAFVVLVAVGYLTNIGIGNMSALGWDAWSVICPLGYLESLLAGKVFIPRALISFVLVVAAIVFLGRVFCAWVCPMPFLQRWMPGLARKKAAAQAKKSPGAQPRGEAEGDEEILAAASEDLASQGSDAAMQAAADDAPALARADGKPNRFALDSRIGVLAGALASAAIFGFPLFCLICPVGLTFATVFLVMRLVAFGEATWTVVVVPLLLLAEVLFARKWCHKFCPLGALIALVSGANKTLRPTIDDAKCIHSAEGKACFSCSKVCPEKLDIRRPEKSQRSLNNCTKCRECAAACPGHAITFPLLPKKQDTVDGGAAGPEEQVAEKSA